jgi:site-specific DNA recombinase
MRAVGYARISRDDTAEGRGVARQEQDIRAVCKRHGWRLVEVLVDNDISASRYSRKARPSYARLLQLIAAGAVERAVVYDADRLLRQPRELEDLIDLAERNGGFEVHTVTGHLDLVTSGGRFVARALVAKAAMESDDLSRRLRRAFDQKAAEGRPHGARAFGYEPDGVTIRQAEAELLGEAAVDVLAGESLNAIARRWNAAGVLTPQRSKLWNGTIVRAVLTGPHQAGLRRHRGEVIGKGTWPAIIDRGTHDALVKLLTDPARRRRTPPRRTPFTSLIRSAVTGLPLQRDVVRGRLWYRAHNLPGREAGHVTIRAEALEALIVETLFAAVNDGALTRRLAERRARQQRTAREDPAALEAELRDMAADHGAGRITRAEWLAARGPLADRLAAAHAASVADPVVLVLDDGALDDLRARWPDLSVDRQRAILAAAYDRVLIHPATGDHLTPEGEPCGRCAGRPGRRGGPAPMVEDVGRIDIERVEPVWRD